MEIPVRTLTGQKEIKDLLAAVLEALCQADLSEEARTFHDRVIVPALSDYSIVLDYDELEPNKFHCKYKPMVELALLEIKAAAEAPGLTTVMRKQRIAEALTMAGF